MRINEIREQIAELISTDMEVWNDVLNNTVPGNYDCDYWEATIDFNDILVHVPNRKLYCETRKFLSRSCYGS